MRSRQSGISTVAVVAGVALLAAAGAGFFAWQNMAEVSQLDNQLTRTRNSLEQARADLKKAAADVAASSKEAKDLKIATERLTAERDAVRVTMEKEQATGERLREELALAKEQVSYLSARSPKEIVRGMPKTAASR